MRMQYTRDDESSISVDSRKKRRIASSKSYIELIPLKTFSIYRLYSKIHPLRFVFAFCIFILLFIRVNFFPLTFENLTLNRLLHTDGMTMRHEKLHAILSLDRSNQRYRKRYRAIYKKIGQSSVPRSFRLAEKVIEREDHRKLQKTA